ncbi:MAG: permease [Bacteroidales bacterium]|nr:permease [Bacteroidales bacterium]MBN2819533.1 permease [Bacteroidales bacterium]
MMEYILSYYNELVALLLDMAPWLVLGFFIAGLLHVFLPDGRINKLLGKSNMKSVIKAALIGIPLPLCSCGVIPTGVSIHKNGASKGAAISFLISTPQTGVDSIMVTYSLLGIPFAIVRPIVALITGVFGGFFTNQVSKNEIQLDEKVNTLSSTGKKEKKNPVVELFRYAFVDFLEDIAKWFIIGLLIAALIAMLVPDDFFASYIKNDFVGMLIILVASIPVYVCATSSVPIAAVLMLKGISPGAALVFLMAGPATNAATISVIGNSMGRKTLTVYLVTLIAGALLSGLFIDYFLPRDWFISALSEHNHNHGLLPKWVHVASGLLMVFLLINIYIRKFLRKFKSKKNIETQIDMGDIKVFVRGMNCNHCKMSVETNLSKLDGINGVEVDLEREQVTLSGDNIDLNKVKTTVESIGYKFEEMK